MRPNQYRAWGILASVYLNQRADAAKVKETYLKAIELAAPLRKETPRDAYLLADLGQCYAFVGSRNESLPLLAQAAALAPDTPEVLYEVAVGYEALGLRADALKWLANAKAGGYPAEAIERNPQLAGLRADPRTAQTTFTIVDNRRCRKDVMADNPNVDRSAPPPVRKGGKKKSGKKR